MPTHDHDPLNPDEGHPREEIDVARGFEASDVQVTGIVVFLVSLAIFVVVAAVLSYGIGYAIFAHLAKEDAQDYGPRSKWSKTVDVRTLGDLASNPALQNKIAQTTEQFPQPRLQTDDGNQEIADLHAKEDLLLENYSWVDQSQGKIRIPIERAMELVAKQGLPVAPQPEGETLLTGDTKVDVAFPLTSGFARTGYEHDKAILEAVEGRQARK
jgi:biopolymer transport protein ExbD